MAKTISSLSVVLGATVAPLVSAFKVAEGAATSLKSGIGSIASSVASWTGIGGVIAGIAGGAGLGLLVKGQLDAIDANAKLSDRLGISTEALSGLQYAADLSGVSSETLTGSLEKMLKNATEAADGNKGLAESFSAIGLDATKLATQSPADSFDQIADGLNSITNPALKAKLAQDIFGKSGQQIIPLLAEGSEGLAVMAKEATDLGLSFNRVDAAKVEEANDAISRVKSAFVGVARSIAIAIAPAIQMGADLMTGWGKRVVAIVNTYLSPIAAVASAAFERLLGVVTGAWSAVYAFTAPIITSIYGLLVGFWSSMLTTAVGYLLSIYNVVSGTLVAAWTIISTAASGIAEIWTWAMNTLGLASVDAQGKSEGAFAAITRAVQWFFDTAALAFNVVAFGVTNFGDVVAAIMLASGYQIVKLGNQIQYVLVDYIGGCLAWFGRNWKEVFADVVNFTDTVFSNLLTNAAAFGKALWEAVKGNGFAFDWTPLTDGFASAVVELPKIAERQAGALEASLGSASDAMNEQLAQGLGSYINEQDAKAKAAADAIKGTFDSIGSSINGAMAGTAGATPKIDAKINIDTKDANKAIDSVKAKAGTLDMVIAGSAEAMAMRARTSGDTTTAAITAVPVSASAMGIDSATSERDKAKPENKLLEQMALLLTQIKTEAAKIVKNTAEPLAEVSI